MGNQGSRGSGRRVRVISSALGRTGFWSKSSQLWSREEGTREGMERCCGTAGAFLAAGKGLLGRCCSGCAAEDRVDPRNFPCSSWGGSFILLVQEGESGSQSITPCGYCVEREAPGDSFAFNVVHQEPGSVTSLAWSRQARSSELQGLCWTSGAGGEVPPTCPALSWLHSRSRACPCGRWLTAGQSS